MISPTHHQENAISNPRTHFLPLSPSLSTSLLTKRHESLYQLLLIDGIWETGDEDGLFAYLFVWSVSREGRDSLSSGAEVSGWVAAYPLLLLNLGPLLCLVCRWQGMSE